MGWYCLVILCLSLTCSGIWRTVFLVTALYIIMVVWLPFDAVRERVTFAHSGDGSWTPAFAHFCNNVLKRAARRCTPSVSLICFGLLQIELNEWLRRLGA